MKEYTLDLTEVKSFYYLHKEIKKSFPFPDFYGENLDALWDCLTGFLDSPYKVTIIGKDKVPKDLKEYVNKMVEVFIEASELDYEDISIEIK